MAPLVVNRPRPHCKTPEYRVLVGQRHRDRDLEITESVKCVRRWMMSKLHRSSTTPQVGANLAKRADRDTSLPSEKDVVLASAQTRRLDKQTKNRQRTASHMTSKTHCFRHMTSPFCFSRLTVLPPFMSSPLRSRHRSRISLRRRHSDLSAAPLLPLSRFPLSVLRPSLRSFLLSPPLSATPSCRS